MRGKNVKIQFGGSVDVGYALSRSYPRIGHLSAKRYLRASGAKLTTVLRNPASALTGSSVTPSADLSFALLTT